MDLLIKNMKKPSCCGECPFFKRYANPMGEDFIFAQPFGDCLVSGKENVVEYDISMDCPLVEVPTHGRLIDADAFKAYLLSWLVKFVTHPNYAAAKTITEEFMKDIDDAPTVLEASNGHSNQG